MAQVAASNAATAPPAATACRLSYRGRFAPSPTGPLHLGSLFTALASYLQSRAHHGAWLLRIDDLDMERVVPGAADRILRTLERFGLFWDGQVTYQSLNIEAYQQAIDTLREKGLLFACTCSRKTLVDFRRYPGICTGQSRSRQEPHALRLLSGNRVVTVHDRLQGDYRQDFSAEVGDFIVRRRDGVHAYHLATVVDDAAAGVTEVLRGVDLLESTPRQMLLQSALDLPTPDYLHVPVLIDSTGTKLSKQTGAKAVDDTRPAAILYVLLGLLGHPPPLELQHAPVSALLEWAISAWHTKNLRATALEVDQLLP